MITKELVDKQDELKDADNEFKHFAMGKHSNADTMRKCLNVLKPLTSKKRPTGIMSAKNPANQWVISQSIARYEGNDTIARELSFNQWVEEFLTEDDAVIEKVAEFIWNKRKKESFIKLHKIMKQLVIKGDPRNHKVEMKVEPTPFFYEDNWVSSKEKNKTVLITAIRYNPNDLYLISDGTGTAGRRNIEIEWRAGSGNYNAVELFYQQIKDLMLKWHEEVDRGTTKDKKTLDAAWESVAKFEMVKKL